MTRGEHHKMLAMILDSSVKGEVTINVDHYVEEMLEEFPIKLSKCDTIMVPANDNLFKRDNSKLLEKLKAELFHTNVAKALFVSKRAQMDILPTVAVLCWIEWLYGRPQSQSNEGSV